MTLVTWLFIVFALYILLIIVIGSIGFRKTQASAEDYYLASRTLGVVTLAGTTVASYISMYTFLGAVGMYYRTGIYFLSLCVLYNILWPLMTWFVGAKIWLIGKKYNYITYSELINDYYNSKWLGIIAAIFGILALLPYIAVQLMGGGLVIETFSNGAIPFSLGVVVTFIFMVLFISLAGVKSVVWTDVFQAFFFLAVMLALAFYTVFLVGGIDNLFQSIEKYNPSLMISGKDPGIWLGFVFTWGLAIFLPHMFQRLMMAKDPMTICRNTFVTSILSGLFQTLPAFIIGICCVILLPDLTDTQTDIVVILFSKKFLSDPLSAIVVGGAFAAGTSTLNSQLLTSSSIVLRDMIVNPFNLKLSPRKEAFLGRLLVFFVGVIIVAIALSKPGLIVPVATAGVAICISSYLFPILGILFIKKTNKLAVFCSMIIAGTVSILTWIVWHFPFGIYNLIWGILSGAIIFIFLSLFTKTELTEKQKEIKRLVAF